MTSEKAVGSPAVSPLAAIALKLVGVVTILSALLDYLVLVIPPDLTNAQWQLATSTQIVDRGIVPLVGVALLLTGFWIESSVGQATQSSSLFVDSRFWACLLSTVLGLIFLLLTVVHINSVRATTQEALSRVSDEATQATTQLQQRLSSELSQQQSQLGALLQNEDLLSQAIASGQIPEDIQQFQNDPEGLNQFLEQRAGEARQQLETQIGTRREEAEQRVRLQARKSAIRISVSSLLLAIGYSIVGWIGLRRLLTLTRA
ncbi:hypothetical protein C7271_20035 [filamentous cyanobacterium CCP5]|nr:hypothetical protein C7271_20035 [filamentous cyanobacterium CCP5]